MEEEFFNKNLLEILPNAVSLGLRELGHNYQKMAHSQIADEMLQKEIRSAIVTFNAILCEAIGKNDNIRLIIEQTESVEDAISFINQAISNRLQSSRYFYEVTTFSPINIAPFSKIFLFYERLLNLIEKLISFYDHNLNDGGTGSKLNFLIDISVHSSVNANLFIPTVATLTPKSRLIGININERCFFQLQETILLLFHEIGHYVRPVSRESRNVLVRNILINWLVFTVDALLRNKLFNKFYSQIDDTFKEDTDKELREIQIQNLRLVQLHFEQEVFKVIRRILFVSLEEDINNFFIENLGNNNTSKNSPNLSINEINRSILQDYWSFLSQWLKSFTNISKITDSPVNKLKQRIKDHLEKNSKILGETDCNNTIPNLYKIANRLFEPQQLFQYREGEGNINSENTVAFDAYLTALTNLNLLENNEESLNQLSELLVNLFPTSLSYCDNANLLDKIFESVDEGFADLFMIQVGCIESWEEYIELITDQADYLKLPDDIKSAQFTIRTDIIKEYFKQKDTLNNTQNNEIIEQENNEFHETLKSQDENIQTILVKPIANFLAKNSLSFSQENFFNINISELNPTEIYVISNFPILFRELFEIRDTESYFSKEIALLNLFDFPENSKV